MFIKKNNICIFSRPIFPTAARLVSDVQKEITVAGKERTKLSPIWTTAAFLFSLTWALAGSLDVQSKELFSTFLKRILYGTVNKT